MTFPDNLLSALRKMQGGLGFADDDFDYTIEKLLANVVVQCLCCVFTDLLLAKT